MTQFLRLQRSRSNFVRLHAPNGLTLTLTSHCVCTVGTLWLYETCAPAGGKPLADAAAYEAEYFTLSHR
jgi:hypothetical protein